MERFIQTVGDSIDRRSFMRWLGKIGMGAAMVAGGLMVPAKEVFASCPGYCTNVGGYCGIEPVGTPCTTAGGRPGTCRQSASCTCSCVAG